MEEIDAAKVSDELENDVTEDCVEAEAFSTPSKPVAKLPSDDNHQPTLKSSATEQCDANAKPSAPTPAFRFVPPISPPKPPGMIAREALEESGDSAKDKVSRFGGKAAGSGSSCFHEASVEESSRSGITSQPLTEVFTESNDGIGSQINAETSGGDEEAFLRISGSDVTTSKNVSSETERGSRNNGSVSQHHTEQTMTERPELFTTVDEEGLIDQNNTDAAGEGVLRVSRGDSTTSTISNETGRAPTNDNAIREQNIDQTSFSNTSEGNVLPSFENNEMPPPENRFTSFLEVTEAYLVDDEVNLHERTWFRSTRSTLRAAVQRISRPTAILVDAEPMTVIPWWKRKSVRISVFVVTILVVLLAVTVSRLVSNERDDSLEGDSNILQNPSLAPTDDPRTTLEIVQARKSLRCGLEPKRPGGTRTRNFRVDLCRAIAASVLGNADSIEEVDVLANTRFVDLKNKEIDVLLYESTYTVEREVKEPITGSGFSFSSPYYYDGLAFAGNDTFVKCAENFKRHDECSSLLICVMSPSTYETFLETKFPEQYLVGGYSSNDIVEMFLNGRCNVVAATGYQLLDSVLLDGIVAGNYSVGDKLYTKEPNSIVTRNYDFEWSDTVNWVLQALIFGEERGIFRNSTMCETNANLASTNFLNAVYCCGNYAQLFESIGSHLRTKINTINQGTGMLYALPFGDLDHVENPIGPISTIENIKHRKSIDCGVVELDGFVSDNIYESTNLAGMGIDMCRALAAAIFLGESNAVNFRPLNESDGFAALSNKTVDILVGGRVERNHFFQSDNSLQRYSFSTPYFYGSANDTSSVNMFSIVTRTDDIKFSSFVDCAILATFFAEEQGISKESFHEMPLVGTFGNDLRWALRDIIYFAGNYRDIYSKNFESLDNSTVSFGRNSVNTNWNPQLLSIPGLKV